MPRCDRAVSGLQLNHSRMGTCGKSSAWALPHLWSGLFARRGDYVAGRSGSIIRDAAAKAAIDQQTASMALYQYEACPCCVKVRRAMKRQGLNIQTRDIKRCDTSREELLAGGGDLKVPCLRIDEDDGGVRRMYESREIIRFPEGKFAAPV